MSAISYRMYDIIFNQRFLEYSWSFLRDFYFLLLTINTRAESWHSIQTQRQKSKIRPSGSPLQASERKKRPSKTRKSKQKSPSALFRGDVGYKRGDPVGHERAPLLSDDEKGEKACDHVLDEIGGYFTSFTRSASIALKFTDHKEKYTFKVRFKNLKELEAKGIICIYQPEDVVKLIKRLST